MNPVSERLVEENQDLVYPYQALGSGILKQKDSDFQVIEKLLYDPCGNGDHVYIRFERCDWNTARIASKIAQILGEGKHSYGYAGMKDRHAVVEQTISIKTDMSDEDIRSRLEQHASEIEILNLSRHQNKLRIGHVKQNHFRIVIRDCDASFDELIERKAKIEQSGCLNYYGPQRFGLNYDNIRTGFDMLKEFKRIKSPLKRKLFASALQGALFNIYLSRRFQADQLCLKAGDILKRSDSGGLFMNQSINENQPRVESFDCVICGPVFGYKMMEASDESADFEDQILTEFHLGINKFKRLKQKGSRRPVLFKPLNLTIDKLDESNIQFSFALPKGSYATTLLKHFINID